MRGLAKKKILKDILSHLEINMAYKSPFAEEQKTISTSYQSPFAETKPKIATLPTHLGGGEYRVGEPGELIKTERGYAGLDTKSQQERDHIISVALGGTSSKANLQYLKTTEAGRQEGKVSVEQSAINDYLDGRIDLPEARAKIAHKQQQIQGMIPAQGFKANIMPALKDTGKDYTGGFKEGFLSPFKTLANLIFPKKATTTEEERMVSRKADLKSFEQPITPEYEEPGFLGQIVESFNESGVRAISAMGSSVEALGVKWDNETIRSAGEKFADDFKKISAQHPEWEAPVDMGKWKDPIFYTRLAGGINQA